MWAKRLVESIRRHSVTARSHTVELGLAGEVKLAVRGSPDLVDAHNSIRFPLGLSQRDHNWLATMARKKFRSPSGLSRREHDLQDTRVPTQSLLPPGQARRRAANAPGRRSVTSQCSPPVVAPAGTGPTEAINKEMCKTTRTPDPARRLTEGLPERLFALIQGDLRSRPRRGRETRAERCRDTLLVDPSVADQRCASVSAPSG